MHSKLAVSIAIEDGTLEKHPDFSNQSRVS